MAPDEASDPAEPDAFGILGPLEVLRSGRAVPLGGPRQRAVLAVLLLQANRVVSADRLVEDVWAGHAPEASVTSLQTYVFHLRRALEPGRPRGGAPEVLATRDRGYLLHVSPERLDAAVFEDGLAAGLAALEAGRHSQAREGLGRVLELWRGPVLADLSDYAFIGAEAARLDELRLAAWEGRIEADLALGRHGAVTAELERLVGDHPLRERLHGQLMLALYRCGRQADALAAYRRVRDLLAAELGIDPGEPLRRLHASVLAHDPALDWNGSRPAAPEGRPAEVGAPAPRPPGPRLTAGRRELGWVRRPRRLLAAGAALAVAAAVCVVAVARPWAGEPAGLPGNSVGLIDSAGGRVGAAVPVGSPDGLAYGDGSVWAVNGTGGTVSRIDPATHAVMQQIPVGVNPAAVAVTGGDVWVTNSGDGTVTRINAAASAVVQKITVGNIPDAIASGPSGIWVADQGDATVDRIDPVTGDVTMRDIPVGGLPGYRATVRNVPQAQYHAALYSASHKIQLGLTGWAVNIPATSDFFLQILTCRSIYQDPAGTANLAGFCEPQVDRLASQAQATQQADPAGARTLWAKLDRTITDQAPLAPVLNTSFTVFVSARVGNYQESPSYGGPLLDQIWIR